jgi:hypothetical protein
MKLPELTPSNERAIAALITKQPTELDPILHFQGYAKRFNGPLIDDPKFSLPLYPDFEDFNYLHDTSRLQQIYLNDFDFNLEDDREELARMTRLEFDSNSFDTVARCSCPPGTGGLVGNYLLGSGRKCTKCHEEAQQFLDKGEDTNLWLKCPEGVKSFINIGFFTTFFSNISIGNPSPKVSVPRYFIDPTYQKAEKKKKNGTMIILFQMLEALGIRDPNLNTFYENADQIMEYILVGPGKRYSKHPQEGHKFLAFYHKYKHLAFCQYIKVPKRYSTVFERTGKDVYSYSHHPETAQLYNAIADTLKSNSCYQLNDKDHRRNIDIVGKNLVLLADQYRQVNNPKALFNKPAISRKHVCAGSIPFTGRSVITSQTGIIDTDVLIVPWKMCVAILEYHITSYLYRRGFTPWMAQALINKAAFEIVPEIDAFFTDMEVNRKCLVETGRNPSIEYLSLRVFFLKANRDLSDESIKLPILGVKSFNADFDGDQMYIVVLADNESKAKAYGGFGHHQVLDKNIPFRVGGYAGQAATNLMNLNTLMAQTPLLQE